MTGRAFQLPPLQDNPDGAWGPSTLHLPAKFKDIPYAPYSKSDKLGRFADWTDGDSSQRGAGAAGAGAGPGGAGRGQGPRAGGRKDGPQAYGSGASNAFSYFHVEDEASFSLVDNKTGGPRRGSAGFGFQRGRGTGRGGPGGRGGAGMRSNNTTYGRSGGYGGRGGFGRGGRRGWKDWEKTSRVREGSVIIDPNWKMLEEIDFLRLSKLRLEVEPPESLESHGRLYAYDKLYDRVTTKTEKPLQIPEKTRFNPSTSDDPVIQRLISEDIASIYATDSIISMLMCAPRSIFGWDIIVIREGDKVILDKRDGGSSDTITVNENAADPPADSEKETINSATSLALEAMFVNTNFAIQVVKEDTFADLQNPNPFAVEETEQEQLASAGYFYKRFDLSVNEDEELMLVLRTEVDAYNPGNNPVKGEGLITIKALNEFDAKAPGAGGAPDWRTKLDSQRGAVVATEMKNNSFKMARWAVQSMLAGAEHMKLGYVSRASTRDNSRHVILSAATVRPAEFAAQLNVSLMNGWGIVRTIVDMCMKHPDGKYLLIKDPNKPVVRLYAVPPDTFTKEDEGEEENVYEEDAE